MSLIKFFKISGIEFFEFYFKKFKILGQEVLEEKFLKTKTFGQKVFDELFLKNQEFLPRGHQTTSGQKVFGEIVLQKIHDFWTIVQHPNFSRKVFEKNVQQIQYRDPRGFFF